MEDSSSALEVPLASKILFKGAGYEEVAVCAFTELSLKAGVSWSFVSHPPLGPLHDAVIWPQAHGEDRVTGIVPVDNEF